MPTTFNWIYLGPSALVLDPTEGNTGAEGASLFENTTFGSATNPLYQQVTRATTIDNGGTFGALDMNNDLSNDQFVTDIGNGAQTFTFDGVATYNATFSYTDGSTANILAIVLQDTAGNLYLAPPFAANADAAVLADKPIESLNLTSLVGSNFSGLNPDRQDIAIDDGIVDGTGGNDVIDATYVEPVASGSDRVDNNDGVGGGNADVIEAGAGNDTVLSGEGDDTVFGGAGADS